MSTSLLGLLLASLLCLQIHSQSILREVVSLECRERTETTADYGPVKYLSWLDSLVTSTISPSPQVVLLPMYDTDQPQTRILLDNPDPTSADIVGASSFDSQKKVVFGVGDATIDSKFEPNSVVTVDLQTFTIETLFQLTFFQCCGLELNGDTEFRAVSTFRGNEILLGFRNPPVIVGFDTVTLELDEKLDLRNFGFDKLDSVEAIEVYRNQIFVLGSNIDSDCNVFLFDRKFELVDQVDFASQIEQETLVLPTCSGLTVYKRRRESVWFTILDRDNRLTCTFKTG